MPHVEHFVHLLPVSATLVVDELEEWWNGEHVVFYHLAVVVDKMQDFCLCSTSAMHHTMYLWAHLVKEFLYDWGVSAGRREHQFAGVDRAVLNFVFKLALTGIYQVEGHSVVIALRIFLGIVFCEHIMTGRCQAVAAHAAVVLLFVCSLSKTCKSHYYIAWTNVGIVYHVAAFHTASNRRIYYYRACQVTNVSSLSACSIYAYSHFTHFGKQFVSAVDDGRDDLTWHEHLVPAYG